jgi:hypothetical protein
MTGQLRRLYGYFLMYGLKLKKSNGIVYAKFKWNNDYFDITDATTRDSFWVFIKEYVI